MRGVRSWQFGERPVARDAAPNFEPRAPDRNAHVAQLVEHILGKDEVSGSIPLMGSSLPAPAIIFLSSFFGGEHGKSEIRAYEAACERRDDRSRGPREDDADGGDHEGAG